MTYDQKIRYWRRKAMTEAYITRGSKRRVMALARRLSRFANLGAENKAEASVALAIAFQVNLYRFQQERRRKQ